VTDNLPCVTAEGRYFRRLACTAPVTLTRPAEPAPNRHRTRRREPASHAVERAPRAITERNFCARPKASRVKQIR